MKLKVEGIEIARKVLREMSDEYHKARLAAISGDEFGAALAQERYRMVETVRDRVMKAMEMVESLEVQS